MNTKEIKEQWLDCHNNLTRPASHLDFLFRAQRALIESGADKKREERFKSDIHAAIGLAEDMIEKVEEAVDDYMCLMEEIKDDRSTAFLASRGLSALRGIRECHCKISGLLCEALALDDFLAHKLKALKIIDQMIGHWPQARSHIDHIESIKDLAFQSLARSGQSDGNGPFPGIDDDGFVPA